MSTERRTVPYLSCFGHKVLVSPTYLLSGTPVPSTRCKNGIERFALKAESDTAGIYCIVTGLSKYGLSPVSAPNPVGITYLTCSSRAEVLINGFSDPNTAASVFTHTFISQLGSEESLEICGPPNLTERCIVSEMPEGICLHPAIETTSVVSNLVDEATPVHNDSNLQ